MKAIALGVLAVLAFSGCIVVHDHDGPSRPPPRHSPPPPPATVAVTFGWNHHRYVLWTEYYGCSDDEVYWLENCGYDDDDILVCLTLARHARVHPRQIFYEYDRCGRNFFTVATAYRIPIGAFFCDEVPRGYACPPPYGNAYGRYWRGEHHYYTNVEFHALVQLRIGVRYYGYNHSAYFDHHSRSRDPHPFRAIVVLDHRKAGSGGRTCDDRAIAKRERPWDHPNAQAWENKRQAERERMKAGHSAAEEREEQEKIRRESEGAARRQAMEDARRRAEEARRAREDDERRHPPAAPRPAPPPHEPRHPEPKEPPPPPRHPGPSHPEPKEPPPPHEPRHPEPKEPPPPPRHPEPRHPEPKEPPPPPRRPEPREPEPKAPPPPRHPEPKHPEPKEPPPPPPRHEPKGPPPPAPAPEPKKPEKKAPDDEPKKEPPGKGNEKGNEKEKKNK